MKIPTLDLESLHAPIRGEILAAVQRVIDSNNFIQGPEVKQLEDRIAKLCGTHFAFGVSSGTDALLISLMGLGIGAGDEVITTDYSFFATAGAIARVGARPVFVDIDPITFNLDPEKLSSVITERTKAIIAVHLFGQCAAMENILELANRHSLKVIEDAAQAIGAEHPNGKKAGNIGDIGCFSFFPSKNLGGFGDGGMVVTNDPDLAEKIRILRVHGAKPKYHHKVIGGNFRLDTIQAAILDVKLNSLETWTQSRQLNARKYEDLFRDVGLGDEFIVLPRAVYRDADLPGYHIYNQFTVRAHERDKLKSFLDGEGIGTAVYYPVPFHRQECFAHLCNGNGFFPESDRAASESLSLPVYPGLSDDSLVQVVQAVKQFYQK